MSDSYKGQNRRDFIKNSAILGAVIAMNPLKLVPFNELKIGEWPAIKERITPIAVIQDTVSLLSRESRLGHVITEALHEESNLVFCGSTFERGKKYFSEVLKLIQSAEYGDETRYQKAAVLTGWLIYRELPAIITPLYKQETSEKGSMYRDTAILKYKTEIQSGANQEEMEDILKLMWHRVASRMHTLTPDKEEWETWVADFADWYHQDRKSMEDFAELLKRENSREWNRYVQKTNFFSENNKLVQMANDFSIKNVKLDKELLSVNGESLYAKMIKRGIRAVKLLDEYFKDNLSEKQIMSRLNIG